MRECWPVRAGSAAGDFNVIELPDGLGRAVGCHHDDIRTLVGPDEVSTVGVDDLVVGLTSGRHSLATGNAKLVEHTTNDAYWGDGGDGSGKNKLGLILMRVRQELRASGPGRPITGSTSEDE